MRSQLSGVIPRTLGLVFLAGAPFFAQEPTIRVDVHQVLVPVVVTDRKGHHVGGLHATDFRIFEDGVEQKIASFSSDTAASLDDVGALGKSPSGASTAKPVGPRHTFVICFDTLHASPAGAARTRQALESLFEKEKAGDAQFVLIGIGRQLQILVPATGNPLALLVKIRSAAFANALGGMDAGALAAQLQNLRSRMNEFCRRCACGVRPGRVNCDSEIDTLKQGVDAEAERWMAPAKELLDQFKSVVEELAKLPTGRTLILVSDGFSINPKREFYRVVAGYLPNQPQFKLEDSGDADPGLQAVLETATSRNVVIDTIDSRGGAAATLASGGPMDASAGASAGGGDMLGTTRSAAARPVPVQVGGAAPANPEQSEDSAGMQQLARSTGGVYSRSNGDLLKALRTALAEGREYYVLAYVPANGARDGKFRTITVETADKKLNLRAKPGYWAPGAAQ